MQSFSQRKGFEAAKIIQVDSMDDSLRIAIWNTLDRKIWNRSDFLDETAVHRVHMEMFSRFIWEGFFSLRLDSRPSSMKERMAYVEHWFFAAPWNKIYDFLEFIIQPEVMPLVPLVAPLNAALEKSGSAYRIIGGVVADIVSKSEVEMLQQTLDDTSLQSVAGHLKCALQLLADRDNHNYRNSIKESISAVESMARIVANDPTATLGEALKALEKRKQLPNLLKIAFDKLYAYTNGEDGIRHAMLAEPDLTAADAKYFLMSCTSFCNYLKAKLPA